ncbi:hypothetical protein K488DRAFT_90188 [Vararia minispora EC-137]|uniref:Uncharacterized protein n=1 Tax=Vararia minispora EC-137 TaxID=1314806 RepID=A0ACB8Q9T5_9AGAM|nr:hypothetical protein K488DRAFT_90188 [Vararia minispora EC-137]
MAASRSSHYSSLVHPGCDVAALRDAQKALDDEIATVRDILSSLRRQRNELSPISRLPPELLLSIFREAHLCRVKRLPELPGGTTIAMTHVCSQWRQIICAVPYFWDDVRLDLGSAWMKRYLHRSSPLPITVSIWGMVETRLFSILVTKHMDRITNLVGRAFEHEGSRCLFFMSLTSPAPLLQSLHLSYKLDQSDYSDQNSYQDSYLDQDSDRDPDVESVHALPLLPKGFLGDDAPSLSSFSLHMIAPHWPLPHLTALTTLTISWYEKDHTVDPVFPTQHHLYSLLSASPLLKFVKLLGCLPEPQKKFDAFCLPNISEFEIRDTSPKCLSLLETIVLPSGSYITVTCDDSKSLFVQNYTALSSWMASYIRRIVEDEDSNVTPIQTLSVSLTYDRLQIHGWSTVVFNEDEPEFAIPISLDGRYLDLTFEFPRRCLFFVEYFSILLETLHTLALHDTLTMSLSVPGHHISQQRMYDILRPYSILKCLRIRVFGQAVFYDDYGTSLCCLPTASIDASLTTSAISQQCALLPDLRILEFYQVGYHWSLHSPSAADRQQFVFYDALFRGAGRSSSLGLIRFIGCGVTESDIQQMRESKAVPEDITILSRELSVTDFPSD